MVTLQKITEPMFDELYHSFLDDGDPYLAKEDWRCLFTPSTNQDEDYCGYALQSDNKIVGMLGMVFSKRTIHGVDRRLCNLHSWYVDEEFRAYSLMLMRPALRLKEHTLTDFTPTGQVCTISKKLGFQPLESRLTLLLPTRSPSNTAEVEFSEDASSFASRLSEADARLVEDHQCDTFGHLLVTEGDTYCLVIFNRVTRHALPYCHIHYISNKPLFARHDRAIRKRLIQKTQGPYIAVDRRLVAGIQLRASITVPFGSQQLFRPAGLRPEDIDSLYSEVSLLQLTTFPNVSHSVGQWMHRIRNIWPSRQQPSTASC